MSIEHNEQQTAAAQEAVGWQRKYLGATRGGRPVDWHNITREEFEQTKSGKWADKYDVRELFASPVTAAPVGGRDVRSAIAGLEGSVAVGSDGEWVSVRRAARDAAVMALRNVSLDCAHIYAAYSEAKASTPAAPGIDMHAPCTEAVYVMARKLLWIAYVWNDHNFDHPYKVAREMAQEFGIESFDQANAWLTEQAKLIDASPKGEDSIARAFDRAVLDPMRREAKADSPKGGSEARDSARWRYVRRKLCLTGNGDGTCGMQAINLPGSIPGWPDTSDDVVDFCEAAIDAAMQAQAVDAEVQP